VLDDEITLAFSFRVPVIGDGSYDAGQIVNHNDTASFQVARGFELKSPAGPFNLNFSGKKVGTLTLSSDSAIKVVTANIVFDGDADIFAPDGGWSDVNITFNSTIKYERAPDNVDGGTETVAFLIKTFEIDVPPLPLVVAGDKTGVRDGQFIDWKVRVKGTKGATNADLEGYVFRDDLSGVGEYVPGTFKVHTEDIPGAATPVDPAFGADATELNYTFPAGSVGDRFLYFQTKIGDDIFMSAGSKTITNTGKVFSGLDEAWSAAAVVTFAVEWIKKEGAISSFDAASNTGQITWTITANQLGATLTNAVITDVLNDKLEFTSATWSTYVADAWGAPVPIVPTDSNSKYNLGNILFQFEMHQL